MGFLGSSERIIRNIFSSTISMFDSNESHLEKRFGKTLSLIITEHCSTK